MILIYFYNKEIIILRIEDIIIMKKIDIYQLYKIICTSSITDSQMSGTYIYSNENAPRYQTLESPRYNNPFSPDFIPNHSYVSGTKKDPRVSGIPTHPNKPNGSEMHDKKIAEVNKNLTDVRQMMSKNLDLVIERGTKVEDLEQSALQLSENADKFKDAAKKLKRKMIIKNIKWTLGIILVICIIIAIIVGLYYATK